MAKRKSQRRINNRCLKHETLIFQFKIRCEFINTITIAAIAPIELLIHI